MAKFHIKKNEKWFYWHLKANNWDKICWSWEFYTTKQNAKNSIEFVQKYSAWAEVSDDTLSLWIISPKNILSKNKN